MNNHERKTVSIGNGVVLISGLYSESGRNEARFEHGVLSQEVWRDILYRRLRWRNPPLFEVTPFDGKSAFILPDELREIRITNPLTRRRYLDEKSFFLYDAKRVIIKS